MAEEEGTQIPGEGEVSSLNPELHKQAQVERAQQKGWKPLEQYTGDPADWVDAAEFLGRQKLYDKLHDSRRQITKMERDIASMAKHFTDMEEASYQRALKDLRTEQAIAVDNQDTAAVVKVTDEIADLKAKQASKVQQQQAQPQAHLTEEFQQWKQDNSWFESDTEMTQDAISIGIGYAAANQGKTQEEILKHVSDRVKKIYPEKFQKKAQPKRGAPVVESGKENGGEQAVAAATKKGKLTVSDLDERETATMKTFLKRGVFKDAAKKRGISEQQVYLEDLAKARGL